MRYCEMETQSPVLAFCDERARFEVQNHWYCKHHACALAQAEERWSGINWFSLTEREPKKKPQLDDDGRFWDDEE
jgi:hypothetical protein